MDDNYRTCSYCSNEFSEEAAMCPHCARPSLYVNVTRAEKNHEREKLNERYKKAIDDAMARGCDHILGDFEKALSKTKAVIARKRHVLESLLNSDTKIYGTYYKECLAGLRLPEGNEWGQLRSFADTRLFGETGKAEIRFAALTLDDFGSPYYGDVYLHLREDMIAHRATVFHTNSALFEERYIGVMPKTGMPAGYRATWADRHKLCVAKLSAKFSAGTKQAEYAKIVLSPDLDPRKDEFIEVHVCGPITIRTIEYVAERKTPIFGKLFRARNDKFNSSLMKYGVAMKVI